MLLVSAQVHFDAMRPALLALGIANFCYKRLSQALFSIVEAYVLCAPRRCYTVPHPSAVSL